MRLVFEFMLSAFIINLNAQIISDIGMEKEVLSHYDNIEAQNTSSIFADILKQVELKVQAYNRKNTKTYCRQNSNNQTVQDCSVDNGQTYSTFNVTYDQNLNALIYSNQQNQRGIYTFVSTGLTYYYDNLVKIFYVMNGCSANTTMVLQCQQILYSVPFSNQTRNISLKKQRLSKNCTDFTGMGDQNQICKYKIKDGGNYYDYKNYFVNFTCITSATIQTCSNTINGIKTYAYLNIYGGTAVFEQYTNENGKVVDFYICKGQAPSYQQDCTFLGQMNEYPYPMYYGYSVYNCTENLSTSNDPQIYCQAIPNQTQTMQVIKILTSIKVGQKEKFKLGYITDYYWTVKQTCTVDDFSDQTQTLLTCAEKQGYESDFSIFYCRMNSIGALTVCGQTDEDSPCTYNSAWRCPQSIYYSKAVSNIQFTMLSMISVIFAFVFYH